MPVNESRLFMVAPPLRCCARLESRPDELCGCLAHWRTPVADQRIDRVWCDQHKNPGDQVIAGELPFRRVVLTVQVYLAGTDERAPVAQNEAYDMLERQVRRLGGVLNLVDATSEIGRGTFLPRRGALRAARASLR